MYKLKHAVNNTYYIDGPAKVGVYVRPDKTAILIDSGTEKNAAKEILDIFKENGWTLSAIVNTHSHSDHLGGNAFLQEETGCMIFANRSDAAIANHTILATASLYGAYPPAELRNNFLMADESSVSYLTDPGFPKELEVIEFPGHSADLVAYKTPDDVVFISDCISSRAVLDKNVLPYVFDVKSLLSTLDTLEIMKAKLFVPAHCDASEDITELVQFNRRQIMMIAEDVLKILETPMNYEELLKKVFDHYKLSLSLEQYALSGSFLRSLLTWLKDDGRVAFEFTDNRMVWKKA